MWITQSLSLISNLDYLDRLKCNTGNPCLNILLCISVHCIQSSLQLWYRKTWVPTCTNVVFRQWELWWTCASESASDRLFLDYVSRCWVALTLYRCSPFWRFWNIDIFVHFSQIHTGILELVVVSCRGKTAVLNPREVEQVDAIIPHCLRTQTSHEIPCTSHPCKTTLCMATIATAPNSVSPLESQVTSSHTHTATTKVAAVASAHISSRLVEIKTGFLLCRCRKEVSDNRSC